MGKFSQKNGKFSKKMDNFLNGSELNVFLRNLYPNKTADHVAADTGLNASQVSKWLNGHSSPGYYALARLIYTYGPDLLSVIVPQCDWLNEARMAEEKRCLDEQMSRILAKRAALEGRS